MSGSTTMVDYSSGGRLSTEDMSGQRCLSDDSLMELRSCGQFENGTPSTSPPYWDTDDDEDDCGILFLYQFKFILVHEKFRNRCFLGFYWAAKLVGLSFHELVAISHRNPEQLTDSPCYWFGIHRETVCEASVN